MNSPPEAWRAAFPELDTRPIYEWAAENISLPHSYAQPGPFSVYSSRYLIEPFHALADSTTRKVVVYKPIQTGGTLLADIAVPWHVANRPGPILWCMQTQPMAEDHATSRAIPVLQNTACLKHLMPRDERKLTKSGVDFPHMPLWIVGSAPANLQSKSVLFLICDEVWIWPDPERYEWAQARVTAFERVGLSKVLVVSQPGEVGDAMDEAYSEGTCENWSVPCPDCGEYFVPAWHVDRGDGTAWGIKWRTDDTTRPGGRWDLAAVAETIDYEAPCGHRFAESLTLKAMWNEKGRYVAQNPTPAPDVRSFRWTSLIVDPWPRLVGQFLKAKESLDQGIADPIKTFFQQRLAEPYNPEARGAGETLASAVAYDVKSPWPDAVARSMMVDVQDDSSHYWVEVREWAANGDSRQLYFGKVFSEEDLATTQKTWEVPDNCVFVDCAHDTRATYAMLIRRRWTGFWGVDRDFFTHRTKKGLVARFYSAVRLGDPASGTGAAGRRAARYFHFASPAVKGIVARLRDGRGAKWDCLPNKDYESQIHAEKRRKVADKKTGREKITWVKTRKHNHAFDLGCMAVVFAMMHPRIDFPDSPNMPAVTPEENNSAEK